MTQIKFVEKGVKVLDVQMFKVGITFNIRDFFSDHNLCHWGPFLSVITFIKNGSVMKIFDSESNLGLLDNFFEVLLTFRAFMSVSYSPDGDFIIAGGRSKNVCIYYVTEGILLKKFEITQNRSLDAVDVSYIFVCFSHGGSEEPIKGEIFAIRKKFGT